MFAINKLFAYKSNTLTGLHSKDAGAVGLVRSKLVRLSKSSNYYAD